MKALIGSLVLRLSGWKAGGQLPNSPKAVVIAAPHTSNWDFILMLAVAWKMGMTMGFLGKAELFKPPLGWFISAVGGVPVDRGSSTGLVDQLAKQFESRDKLLLGIPAEGTRSRADYWKSGFYRIAEAANVPIVLSYIDKNTKTAGMGIEFTPSGNIHDDMKIIAEFYADKGPLKPENFGPIRLKEDAPERKGNSEGNSEGSAAS